MCARLLAFAAAATLVGCAGASTAVLTEVVDRPKLLPKTGNSGPPDYVCGSGADRNLRCRLRATRLARGPNCVGAFIDVDAPTEGSFVNFVTFIIVFARAPSARCGCPLRAIAKTSASGEQVLPSELREVESLSGRYEEGRAKTNGEVLEPYDWAAFRNLTVEGVADGELWHFESSAVSFLPTPAPDDEVCREAALGLPAQLALMSDSR